MDCLVAVKTFMLNIKDRNRSVVTLENYFSSLIRLFRLFGLKPIEDYTPDDFRAWKFLNNSSMSNNTIHDYLKFFKSFFNFCIENKWIMSNPILERNIPKCDAHEPKYIKESEYGRLIVAAENLCLRDKTIFHFLDSTGTRRSEVSRLNVGDINWEHRTAFIRGKGGINYIVKFSETCAFELWELIPKNASRDSPVFINCYGNRLGVKSIYKICVKLGKTIGAEKNIHPHRLRHTKATRMVRQGHSILAVKQALGHRRLATTQRYAYIERTLIKHAYYKAKEKE